MYFVCTCTRTCTLYVIIYRDLEYIDLLEKLKSTGLDSQKDSATVIRKKPVSDDAYRIKVAAAGAIPPLVKLLGSTSVEVQMEAAGALTNLCVNDDIEVSQARMRAPCIGILLASSSVEVSMCLIARSEVRAQCQAMVPCTSPVS